MVEYDIVFLDSLYKQRSDLWKASTTSRKYNKELSLKSLATGEGLFRWNEIKRWLNILEKSKMSLN